jgi:hypothetical protein
LDVLQRRGHRIAHPRVLRDRLPTHECDASAGPDRARQVRERGVRVREEHHAEAGEHEIDAGRRNVRLRVGVLEAQGRAALGARLLARQLEQRRRDVDAEHGAGRPDAPRSQRVCRARRRRCALARARRARSSARASGPINASIAALFATHFGRPVVPVLICSELGPVASMGGILGDEWPLTAGRK